MKLLIPGRKFSRASVLSYDLPVSKDMVFFVLFFFNLESFLTLSTAIYSTGIEPYTFIEWDINACILLI